MKNQDFWTFLYWKFLGTFSLCFATCTSLEIENEILFFHWNSKRLSLQKKKQSSIESIRISHRLFVSIKFFFAHKQFDAVLKVARRFALKNKIIENIFFWSFDSKRYFYSWQRNRQIPEHIESDRLVMAVSTFESTFQLTSKNIWTSRENLLLLFFCTIGRKTKRFLNTDWRFRCCHNGDIVASYFQRDLFH